jgi:hypothetical protein
MGYAMVKELHRIIEETSFGQQSEGVEVFMKASGVRVPKTEMRTEVLRLIWACCI